MFSRFKADRTGGGGGSGGGGGGGSGGGPSSPSQALLEGNAITTYFEVGRQTATAGPGYLWKVHDAYRKSDGKVGSYIPYTVRNSDSTESSAGMLHYLCSYKYHHWNDLCNSS